MDIPVLSAADVTRLLPPAEAVDAIREALRADVDPELDAPRLFSPLDRGEFLLMPASSADAVGIKVVTIAPDNPAAGLPKIQALYVLFDARTLAPTVLLDGSSLTLVRTPATTVFAIRELLAGDSRGPRERVERLAVFGTGPQAFAHIRTLQSVLPVDSVAVRGRDGRKSADFARRVTDELGVPAAPMSDVALRSADVVICVTSTTEPLFDGRLLAPDTVVASVGTHGLDAREVGPELLDRADIVVEARAAALREYGDLIPARPAEHWAEAGLPNLRDLAVGGVTRTPGNLALFTGVGMSWQDLVVVTEVVRRHRDEAARRPDGSA